MTPRHVTYPENYKLSSGHAEAPWLPMRRAILAFRSRASSSCRTLEHVFWKDSTQQERKA